MKILFVGEGPHDIGRLRDESGEPTRAGGVAVILARRVQPAIAGDSIAIRWSELHRFNRDAAKKGFLAKVRAAALIAGRRYGCDAVVCVTDRDRDGERIERLREGAEQARPLAHCIVGVAVESIEAWTLGAPEAIAAELGVSVAEVNAQYPAGIHVERLYENSGKEEHRPKALLGRIAGIANREAGQAFRDAVAERTDTARLAVTCPEGFGPFCDGLKGIVDEG